MKLAFEVFLQTVLAFFSILFFTRIIGKKQIAELTFYDYVNGITFGSIAATMATDINQRTWHHLLGLFLFAALTFLMQYVTIKNRRVQKVIEGEPTLLIHQGKVLEDNMKKTRFNMGDLLSELRQNDIFDIKDVHYAIMETDGKISILPVASKKSLTPEDLNLQGSEGAVNTELIVDGKVIEPNLKQHGLNREWLEQKLSENDIARVEDVVLANYNPVDKSLYFDLKKDNLDKDTVDISDVEE